MKKSYIVTIITFLPLMIAFKDPDAGYFKNSTIILNPKNDHLANQEILGSVIFKIAYTSVQKNHLTALSQKDYDELLKKTSGNYVLTKKSGQGTFTHAILYTKRLKMLNKEDEDYQQICKILAKYE